MKKGLVLACTILVVAALSACSGNGTSQATNTNPGNQMPVNSPVMTSTSSRVITQPVVTPTAKYSNLLVSFSGTGDQTTDSFNPGDQGWQAIYSCQVQNADNPAMSFTMYMYPSNSTTNYFASVLGATSPRAGILNEYKSGSMYIKVIAANTAWTINIYN
jgi:hypothetical protein